MYYYKARMYSPTLGRFLQTDPIGYNDQINLYAYVGNDPVGRRDPLGLYQCVSDDCLKFESYRQILITARDTYKPASSEYKTLDASLQKIGEPGKGDLKVKEAGESKNPSILAQANGNTNTITIFIPTLQRAAKNSANVEEKLGASVIAHEANPTHMSEMANRADRMRNEVGGFTAQEAASRALGVFDYTQSSAYGPDRETRINNNAINSVNGACGDSVDPTCR